MLLLALALSAASPSAWLAERATCTRALDGSPAPRDAARRCLETSYRWRLDDLSSRRRPPKLPPGFVEKRIVRRDPRIRDLLDLSYPALAPGRPGAAAFDAFFAKEARSRVEDAGEKPDVTDDPLVPETSLTAAFAIPLATPRLVTFPPYAVGPYAIGSPEVRFTWAELKPHLRPDSPLPPR